MGYPKNNYRETPLVYIVLPLYNGERYLLEQLMSIYYQNYTNWYLIIVNDGSTDSSEKIAQKFIKDYGLEKKVQIINKENGGLNSAITVGLERVCELCDIYSSNALISYCDQDDIWTREKLSIQTTYMEQHKDCGLSYHDLSVIDENGILKKASQLKNCYQKEDFIWISTVGTWFTTTEIMFRAKYINDIIPMPIGFKMHQDFRTCLVLSFLKVKICFIGEQLAYIRRGHQSLSRTYNSVDQKKQNDAYIKYFTFLQDRFPDDDLSYIIQYNRDVFINWYNKGHYLRYILILKKYPKVFFLLVKKWIHEKLLNHDIK